MVQFAGLLAVLAASATFVRGHPGQSHAHKLAELRERNEYISQLDNRDLAHCTPILSKRSELNGMVERRREMVKALRKAKGLNEYGPHYKVKRSPQFPPGGLAAFGLGANMPESEALKKSHKSNLTITSPKQADWALLGQNRSTILAPEATEGPYYVSGDYIRKNIKDKEPGIDLHLDIQVIDMTTCLPLPNLAVEVWSANSTGVYSGVVDFMSASSRKEVIENKALRGIQITDKNGAVQFESIMPGHYMGRAHHIHVATHINATIHPNNTVSGGKVPHVGQIYFDQDLLEAVEKVAPYAQNSAPLMRNKDDFLMMQGSAGGADPIVEYVLLGKDISEGVFAWINFGVNPKANRAIMAATVCTAEGCKNSVGDLMNALSMIQKGFNGLYDAYQKGMEMLGASLASASPSPATPNTTAVANTTGSSLNTNAALVGAGMVATVGAVIGGLIGAYMPANTTFTFDSIMAGLATFLPKDLQSTLSSLGGLGALGGGLPDLSALGGLAGLTGLGGLGALGGGAPAAPAAAGGLPAMPGMAGMPGMGALPSASSAAASGSLSSAFSFGLPSASAGGAAPAAASPSPAAVPKAAGSPAPAPMNPMQRGPTTWDSTYKGAATTMSAVPTPKGMAGMSM